MLDFFLLSVAILMCFGHTSYGLVCLNCREIAHPRFCEHVVECRQGEACGIEKIVDSSDDVLYNLGCSTSQTCQTSAACKECCTNDLCNSHGCGEPDIMFSNVTVCYGCQGNLPTEACHKISFCKHNEVCFRKEEIRSGEKYIQTGCMANNVCDFGFQQIFGKRLKEREEPTVRCCSGNLCNGPNIMFMTTTPHGPITGLQSTQYTLSSNCTSKVVDSPINCNFEISNICGFTQERNDNFDWYLNSGMTSSLNTGPSADHTYGTTQGHYMYIEASIAEKSGDKAWLLTPQIPVTSTGQCLSFWYNMYGVSIGTLNVYAATDVSNVQPEDKIGYISGNQGQLWHQKCIPMSNANNITIIFEGMVTDGYTGDIAIDDVQLNTDCPCQCNGQNYVEQTTSMPTTYIMATATTVPTEVTNHATTTEATLPPATTSPTLVESPINCNFEASDNCNYMQESNDTHDWIRHAGPTNSLNTGPNADHTYGLPKGHYVYLESSNSLQQGEKARLWTPTIVPSKGQCLSFWYNMYGLTIGTLNIYTANNSTGSPQLGNPICSISGNQGPLWHQKCVLLPESQPISVLFEAVTGDGFTGDVALDDVQLNFKCPCAGVCS